MIELVLKTVCYFSVLSLQINRGISVYKREDVGALFRAAKAECKSRSQLAGFPMDIWIAYPALALHELFAILKKVTVCARKPEINVLRINGVFVPPAIAIKKSAKKVASHFVRQFSRPSRGMCFSRCYSIKRKRFCQAVGANLYSDLTVFFATHIRCAASDTTFRLQCQAKLLKVLSIFGGKANTNTRKRFARNVAICHEKAKPIGFHFGIDIIKEMVITGKNAPVFQLYAPAPKRIPDAPLRLVEYGRQLLGAFATTIKANNFVSLCFCKVPFHYFIIRDLQALYITEEGDLVD